MTRTFFVVHDMFIDSVFDAPGEVGTSDSVLTGEILSQKGGL